VGIGVRLGGSEIFKLMRVLQIIDLLVKLFRYITANRSAIFTHVSEEFSASIFRTNTLKDQESDILDNKDR
jgi:hypothetical protein